MIDPKVEESELVYFKHICVIVGDGGSQPDSEEYGYYKRDRVFTDKGNKSERRQNTFILDELEEKNITFKSIVCPEEATDIRTTDLAFSSEGNPVTSTTGPIGDADAASNSTGLNEVNIQQGGKNSLYLNGVEVAVIYSQVLEEDNEPLEKYPFTTCYSLSRPDQWKLNAGNAGKCIEYLLRPECLPDWIVVMGTEMSTVIDRRFPAPLVKMELEGASGGRIKHQVAILRSKDQKQLDLAIVCRDKTLEAMNVFSECLQSIAPTKATSAEPWRTAISACCTVMNQNLVQIYKKTTMRIAFAGCINQLLQGIVNVLEDSDKYFLNVPRPAPKSARLRKGGGGTGGEEDSTISLQTTPSVEENETLTLTTNEKKIDYPDTKQQPEPGQDDNNLKKSLLQIYKTTPEGELVFEPVIQLFGNGSYGGYISIENGEGVFKIFTSNQEVDEYIDSHLPELQEYSEQQLTPQVETTELAPQVETKLETKLAPQVETPLTQVEPPLVEPPLETTTQYIPEKKPEEAPEEASGILSYIGLGGQNKSRRNRNRNKSRKVRKTKRHIEKSNKRSRKHEKIINHTKTKNNH
jgi:hypothetical protein